MKTIVRKVWHYNCGTKKIGILKNKAEKLLKTNDRPPKTKLNKPENKAEKLLKTRSCGKNKAKNKATDVVENKRSLNGEPEHVTERVWVKDIPPEGQPCDRETSHGATPRRNMIILPLTVDVPSGG
ncbi:MAG: hypothetical protein WB819_09315 [Terriglobia bacterium]